MTNPVIRIAVTDDHHLVRSGLKQILDSYEDFQVVIEAANGKELMEQLEEKKPTVVLLDLEMPVMNGKETLSQILEQYPDIKVIILTMYNHNSFVVDLMEHGASGYLLKDCDPQELLKAIRIVVSDGIYFNSKVSRALLAAITGNKTGSGKAVISNDLSQRDVDILNLICKEHTTNEIAEKLFLSPKTIEGYRKSLLEKTGAKNAAGLAIYAVKKGLIDW